MKLSALFLSAMATTVLATQKHCTKADFEGLNTQLTADVSYTACASDVGVSVEAFAKMKELKPEQTTALIGSSNCKALWTKAQTAAKANGCLELYYGSEITWPMVTSMLEVGSYPKVTARCDQADFQKALGPLFQNQNIMPCFSATGLYANLFTKTMPTKEQITNFGQNDFCRALYNDAINLLSGLPHCAVDSKGFDIHAIEKLDFDSFVGWVSLGSDFLHQQVAPQLMTMAMAALQPESVSDGSSSTLLVSGSVAAGFLLAFVAMFVYNKVREEPARYGESSSLLQI
ncbi:hypothetical protein SDRG_07704 [Saprolegnia diclina VS20]|uniref:Uncharacterized protein n=1 Tax=Saprolegnia diclina (strain VS20) TaxID=1156394 RepID=T0QM83_SAPDV|nr:hypothetical protein SDRG_07704 [Saprolegnia diclina VS20]EQC34905.1 hypothetical protein SDRG_07704 [Saprolegnia diclina VS20]|eukprot:XP_008611777.1 hypothetical protein SDRG_07704 [Saprolegnia diclina VS20]